MHASGGEGVRDLKKCQSYAEGTKGRIRWLQRGSRRGHLVPEVGEKPGNLSGRAGILRSRERVVSKGDFRRNSTTIVHGTEAFQTERRGG